MMKFFNKGVQLVAFILFLLSMGTSSYGIHGDDGDEVIVRNFPGAEAYGYVPQDLGGRVIHDPDTGAMYFPPYTPIEVRIGEAGREVNMPDQASAIDSDPEAVLGQLFQNRDGREPVLSPAQNSIYRIHAQVNIITGRSTYGGSGTLVGPHHLLTAGHNLYDQKYGGEGWAQAISVRCATADCANPFGEQQVVRAYTYRKWVSENDKEYDLALFVLDRPIGHQIGWAGLAYLPILPTVHPLLRGEFYIAGYPQKVRETRFPEEETQQGEEFTKMWKMSNKKENGTVQRIQINPLTLNYSIDTSGGQSGSSLWYIRGEGETSELYTVGVHAYGGIGSNSATRITRDRFTQVMRWITYTYEAEEFPEEIVEGRDERQQDNENNGQQQQRLDPPADEEDRKFRNIFIVVAIFIGILAVALICPWCAVLCPNESGDITPYHELHFPQQQVCTYVCSPPPVICGAGEICLPENLCISPEKACFGRNHILCSVNSSCNFENEAKKREAEGDRKGAVDFYRKALDMSPEDPRGLINFYIGDIYFHKGGNLARDFDEAFKWFNDSANHQNIEAAMRIAEMHKDGWLGSKNYAEAIIWYEKVLEWSPQHTQPMYYLGNLYYEGGNSIVKDQARAKTLYEEASALGHEPSKEKLAQINEAPPPKLEGFPTPTDPVLPDPTPVTARFKYAEDESREGSTLHKYDEQRQCIQVTQERAVRKIEFWDDGSVRPQPWKKIEEKGACLTMKDWAKDFKYKEPLECSAHRNMRANSLPAPPGCKNSYEHGMAIHMNKKR